MRVTSAAVDRVAAASRRPAGVWPPELVSLASGEPDFATPPPILDALDAAARGGHTHYIDHRGDPELRAAIAADVEHRTGRRTDPEEVLVTHGGSGGVTAAVLALVDPGERVVIPEPSYSLYADAVRLAGGDPVFVPTAANNHLDLDAIAAAVDGARMLVLCNPCNPTGAVYREGELEEVARIAARADALVLSDEAYAHIVYDEHRFVSAAALPDLTDRLVLCQTLSKKYAMTGLRVGYLVAPRPVVDACLRVHRTFNGPGNAAIQRAAIAAIEGSDEWPDRMRAEYAYRRGMVIDALGDLDGAHLFPPEGTFFAFVRSRSGLTSRSLVERLGDAGVAVRQGAEFGPSGDGAIRLSFATDRDKLREGLERVREGLTSLSSG
jgi:aspartate aminotransferase